MLRRALLSITQHYSVGAHSSPAQEALKKALACEAQAAEHQLSEQQGAAGMSMTSSARPEGGAVDLVAGSSLVQQQQQVLLQQEEVRREQSVLLDGGSVETARSYHEMVIITTHQSTMLIYEAALMVGQH